MARERPKQITVRGVPPEVGKRLHGLAKSRGESLNTTVLGILKAAVGIDERRRCLERYATWSQEDLEEFQKALREQRTIDERLWK